MEKKVIKIKLVNLICIALCTIGIIVGTIFIINKSVKKEEEAKNVASSFFTQIIFFIE